MAAPAQRLSPWWAWACLAVLVTLAVASITLNGVVVYALISQSHHSQMEICRLYVVLHRDQVTAVVIPPRCLP